MLTLECPPTARVRPREGGSEMMTMILMMVIVMRMRRKSIVINDIQAWTLCPVGKKAGTPRPPVKKTILALPC